MMEEIEKVGFWTKARRTVFGVSEEEKAKETKIDKGRRLIANNALGIACAVGVVVGATVFIAVTGVGAIALAAGVTLFNGWGVKEALKERREIKADLAKMNLAEVQTGKAENKVPNTYLKAHLQENADTISHQQTLGRADIKFDTVKMAAIEKAYMSEDNTGNIQAPQVEQKLPISYKKKNLVNIGDFKKGQGK